MEVCVIVVETGVMGVFAVDDMEMMQDFLTRLISELCPTWWAQEVELRFENGEPLHTHTGTLADTGICNGDNIEVHRIDFSSLPNIEQSFFESSAQITAFDFTPCGREVAVGYSDGALRKWNVMTGKARLLLSDRSCINSLVAGENTVTMCSRDGSVERWDETHCEKAVRKSSYKLQSCAKKVVLHSNGTTFAFSSRDEVSVRNTMTGYEMATLVGHSDSILCACLSSDEKFLYTGSKDKTIRRWCTTSFNKTRLTGHTDDVTCIASSNKYLISGSKDKTIRVWEGDNPNLSILLIGHEAPITDLQYNISTQKKHTVFSSSMDNTVREWDLNAGRCLRVFLGHKQGVVRLSMNVKGLLCTAGGDNVLRAWDINIEGNRFLHPVTMTHGFTGSETQLREKWEPHCDEGSNENTGKQEKCERKRRKKFGRNDGNECCVIC